MRVYARVYVLCTCQSRILKNKSCSSEVFRCRCFSITKLTRLIMVHRWNSAFIIIVIYQIDWYEDPSTRITDTVSVQPRQDSQNRQTPSSTTTSSHPASSLRCRTPCFRSTPCTTSRRPSAPCSTPSPCPAQPSPPV